MKSDKKIKIILALFVLFMAAMFLVNKYTFIKDIGVEEIRAFIESKGSLGPLIYVALLTVLPLLLFPDSIIVIAGGMAFGLYWGTLWTSIGSLLGGMISFYIARYLGKDFVQKYTRDISLVKGRDGKVSGFFLILILRLIPLFPFKVVSYSAGLTNVRALDFAVATVVGSLPGIIVYTNLGDKSTDMNSSSFYVSIALLVGLILVSIGLKRYMGSGTSEDFSKKG